MTLSPGDWISLEDYQQVLCSWPGLDKSSVDYKKSFSDGCVKSSHHFDPDYELPTDPNMPPPPAPDILLEVGHAADGLTMRIISVHERLLARLMPKPFPLAA